MTNTEKPSGKDEKKKQVVMTLKQNKKPVKRESVKPSTTAIRKNAEGKDFPSSKRFPEKEEKSLKEEKKVVEGKKEEFKKDLKETEKKVDTKKIETKKDDKKKTTPKIKKDFAVVNGKNIPVSTKDCIAICKFIKFKKIEDAINDLGQIIQLKKAVPMKGEIPHRKGKIMSGRFPIKAAKRFIILLKSLQGNANMYEIEEPIISEAIANIGERPFGRFGIRKKRTHVKIVVRNREKKKIKKEKSEKGLKKSAEVKK